MMYTNFYQTTWTESVNHSNSDTFRYNNGLMSYSERETCEKKQEEDRTRAWYGRESDR